MKVRRAAKPGLTIEFAQIDARDDVYTRYSPVAFVRNDRCIENEEWTPSLGALQVRMEREYLVEVAKIQNCIRDKYLRLAKTQVPEGERPIPPEEVWGYGMTHDHHDEEANRAVMDFPGPEAAYYT